MGKQFCLAKQIAIALHSAFILYLNGQPVSHIGTERAWMVDGDRTVEASVSLYSRGVVAGDA